jgi:glycosyltransferase involved in cell wall biosynthesis
MTDTATQPTPQRGEAAISVVCTVLNEGHSIQYLLDSLVAQTRSPDEIIFVDGGSRDNTVEVIRRYSDRLPLRILVEPGCNISAGRNRGIAEAQGYIIAVTDAGVVLEASWLEQLTQPLLNDPRVRVVAGWFEADPRTVFEAALGATTLPQVSEIKATSFLPSSRSIAFRKAAWSAVGGYPEWIDYCEDLIFDMRLQKVAGQFAFAPHAVAHFRPRPSLAAFYRQYYLYARGDGKADLWRKRHLIRYLTYLVALPTLLILTLFVHPIFALSLVGGAAVYLRQPYARLPEVMRRLPEAGVPAWLRAVILVPVIRVAGDIAKMIGYPVGLAWRQQMQPPDWRKV